ncbi:(p)ppGpp synthase/HD superfamily hydrolase [Pedobacter cryoconitis]|uniref:(P)ppGpp synthase/HD superfamily hydrolase n=1 Tax=Pedobacter cryoconitis TaxID=188932 RepID=A0A7W8YPI7_9SPHI|nr:HD domain-containing protein [Pedobacter cryoconitis]MBB5619467.1 (p)ppGpp synthase/HD superfamily hydrolase [Pedobacter cryoconitis]MBB5644756.1 (p)ppGpp synthase/HD superfamily hydrolase [Pedobacter cryoconitis]
MVGKEIKTTDYKRLFNEARAFAVKSHGDQKYGVSPYEIHLGNVISVLMKFNVDLSNPYNLNLLIAAWLHDVLEDTAVTKAELEEKFGTVVTEIVYTLSDDQGASREERKINFYKKIAKNEEAIIVKLADRISNVEFSIIHGNDRKFEMYKVEQLKLEEVLIPVLKSALGLELLTYLRKLLK